MLVSDYEIQVLRAHKDADLDALRAGTALAAARERLIDLGLLDEEWDVTVTGDDILSGQACAEGCGGGNAK